MRRILLLACFLLASSAIMQAGVRWPRVRLGGVMVNAGYTNWGPAWPYGWYGFGPMYPWAWGGGMYAGGFYPAGYLWAPDKGEVRLVNAAKDAEVYIDGAFAGQASGLKSMWLSPGAYNIEVRGSSVLKKRIYVLSGKVLRIQ